MGSRLLAPLLCLSLAIVPTAGRAAVWYVTPGGSGARNGTSWSDAFPTVTAALAAAGPGDSVQVWAGVYHERITLKDGVNLTGGYLPLPPNYQIQWLPLTATLDGDGGGSVVTVASGAGFGAYMAGFVIQNGSGTSRRGKTYGGGIYCADASPMLYANLVTGCHADYGGGLYLDGSSAEVKDCVLANDQASSGGGVYASAGSPNLRGCAFRANIARVGGGFAAGTMSGLLVSDCVFEGNRANQAGNAAALSQGLFRNNTVIRNVGPGDGAVAILPTTSEAGVIVVNNIIAANSSGLAAVSGAVVPLTSVRHNDVYGNTGGDYLGMADRKNVYGNISREPALEDPLFGSYAPAPGSPVIDQGDDSVIPTVWKDYHNQDRIQGVCVDIGAGECIQPAPRAAICVSPNGDDANSGADWAHAKRMLQTAIDEAIATGKEVWVAAGTYVGGVYRPLEIVNGNVMLYGGFAGTETLRNQRDPEKNATYIASRFQDDACLFIQGEPNEQRRVDRRTVVDGFCITGGLGRKQGGSTRYGGGLCIRVASPVISGNWIYGCATTRDAQSDYYDGSGGGIYIDNQGNTGYEPPVIACNQISGNSACNGGGLCVKDSTAAIRNNLFYGNNGHWGSNSGGNGGAMYLVGECTVTGNRIDSNNADWGAAGVEVTGPVAKSTTLRGNALVKNSSNHWYGGLGISGSSVQVLNNTVTGNGGDYGNWCSGSDTVTVANNLFAGNGGYYVDALYVSGKDVTVINNTFYGIGKSGDNSCLSAHGDAADGKLNVTNNIITYNYVGLAVDVQQGSTLQVSNNCLFDNATDYTGVYYLPEDIHTDPLFVNATGGDFHLQSGSPCIDAPLAMNSIGFWDVAGQPRVQGTCVDIGAYESTETGIGPIGIASVITALRTACGLEAATPATLTTLNVENTGTSQGRIDLCDAARLMRMVAGLG